MGVKAQFAAFTKGLSLGPGLDIPFQAGSVTGNRAWPWVMPSSRINYQMEAGDLTQSAVVMSCVFWIAKNLPEAPLIVQRQDAKGQWNLVPDHPGIKPLESPNPAYNGLLLLQALVLSWLLDGNAYCLKMRDGQAKTSELWWEPHTTIRPVIDDSGKEWISGYQLQRKGKWMEQVIPPDRVVHLRYGMDPDNPRLGISPLGSALREVFTDNEAANFTASLVRNLGVPGLVAMPIPGSTDEVEDPEDLKKTIMRKFGGDRKGEPLVLAKPMKLEKLSFSPSEMNLEALRTIPADRIISLCGLSADLIGMGSGAASKFTNYAEARVAAYQDTLIPIQKLWTAQWKVDLLPDYSKNPDKERYYFDLSQVSALADDQNALYARQTQGWSTGWLKRLDARKAVGLDVDEATDNIYITDVQLAIAQLKAQAQAAAHAGPTAPPGQGPPQQPPGGPEGPPTTPPDQPLEGKALHQLMDWTTPHSTLTSPSPLPAAVTTERRAGEAKLVKTFDQLMADLEGVGYGA